MELKHCSAESFPSGLASLIERLPLLTFPSRLLVVGVEAGTDLGSEALSGSRHSLHSEGCIESGPSLEASGVLQLGLVSLTHGPSDA